MQLSADFRPIRKLQERFLRAHKGVSGYLEDEMDEFANIALQTMRDYSPVKYGNLRDSWYIVTRGKYVRILQTDSPYAKPLNDGYYHTARFVPGYWSGDTFHYERSSPTGQFFKAGWRDGFNFLEKTVAHMEDDEARRFGRDTVRKIRKDLEG